MTSSVVTPMITTVPLTPSVDRSKILQNLEKCVTMPEIKQLHSRIIRQGLSSDNYIVGGVIKFCSLSPEGDLNYARKLFEVLPHPDTFIYNNLIKGYQRSQMDRQCLILFFDMLENSIAPNNFTFPYLIRACSDGNNVEEGRQLHAQVVKWGYGENGYSLNNLIFMYMGFELVEHARLVFDKIPQSQRSDVSWTTLISGYSQWGLIDEALEAGLSSLRGERNSSTWNAIISACVQHNRFEEAFDLFDQMLQDDDMELNRFIATSMLSACSGLGALAQGEWIHDYIEKNKVRVDTKLFASIVDMYCKCGCLEKAVEVFYSFSSSPKGISAWNCMIGGLAMHGKGKEALDFFKEMEKDGTVVPDRITFLYLLAACAHSGLVAEGQYYFQYMKEVYSVEPEVEHFGCMVDLLGRSGLLGEAEKLVDEMPLDMADKSSVLGALCGACKIHGNVNLGEVVGRRVIELDPNNSGRYVLLANLYARAGRWADVAKIRKLMDDRGVKKIPGYSMIEWDGRVNKFIAGERNHPESEAIYAKVEDVMERIKSMGYLPIVDDVKRLADDEESDDKSGRYHSERLAIAYGLMKTKPGETIRVTKNLRVCEDCHEASKYISRAFGRVLIVRDRKRFHHFKNGECSCKDYW